VTLTATCETNVPGTVITNCPIVQTGGPMMVTLTPVSQSGIGTPTAITIVTFMPAAEGDYTFEVTATRSGVYPPSNNTRNATVTVSSTVTPPTTTCSANAGPDQNVVFIRSGTQVTLTGACSDSAFGIVTGCDWSQTSGPSIAPSAQTPIGPSTNLVTNTISFTPTENGTYAFTLTATCDNSAPASDTVTLLVTSPPTSHNCDKHHHHRGHPRGRGHHKYTCHREYLRRTAW
jgi:hypothetical protein